MTTATAAVQGARFRGDRMAKTSPPKIEWLSSVEERRYPSAECYLSLVYPEERAREIVAALRDAPVTQFQGKDIFRASGLSLLGVSDSHVEKDRVKIRKGQSLSPILLVRDEQNGKVVIADGYHRLCAIYGYDEDSWIRCQIV
jgi:disulfide oxidoreductase YuzD